MTAALIDGGHRVPGQLNALVLDKDSSVTGFGRHHRVRVGLDVETRLLVCDEDLWTGPREATLDEVRKVANHPNQKVHAGRLVHVSSERWTSGQGEHIEHTFRVEPTHLRVA